MSKLIGEPFLRWQRHVADVGLEFDPITGRYIRREVWVTVPRQSGKTTLVLCIELDRGITFPYGLPPDVIAEHRLDEPQSIVYSAQTGFDARKKLIEDQAERKLIRPDIAQFVDRVKRGVGNESIDLVTGSTIQPISSSAEAGHGRTLDLAVADEAFADTTAAREGSLMPAMNSRKWGQLWGISTAGTDESLWLKSKVELGRAAVLEGDPSSSIAYFEWSGDAADDPADESKWWEYMPALGTAIGDLDVVRHAQRNLEPGEFDRAYRNLWTVTGSRLLPADVWDGVNDPTLELDGSIVLGIDADSTLSTAAIVACDASGRLELVDTVALGALVNLVAKISDAQGARVALDKGGPLTSKVPDLEAALGADRLISVGVPELVAAAGELYSAIGDGECTIRTDGRFEEAAAAAQKRKVGDRWLFVRTPATIPIVAASLAYWARRTIGQSVHYEPEPDFVSL